MLARDGSGYRAFYCDGATRTTSPRSLTVRCEFCGKLRPTPAHVEVCRDERERMDTVECRGERRKFRQSNTRKLSKQPDPNDYCR